MIILIAFFEAAWDVISSNVSARPLFWTLYTFWIVCAGVSAQYFLDRHPLRGASYALLSASCFGAVVALGA